MKKLTASLLSLCVLSCATRAPLQSLTPEQADSLRSLPTAPLSRDFKRGIAQAPETGGVLLYRVDHPTIQLPPLKARLDFQAQKETSLEALRGYLNQQGREIELSTNANLGLRIERTATIAGRTSVHLQQTVERRLGSQKYRIPVEGSSLVALIRGGQLQSLNVTFETPPQGSFLVDHPGFDFSKLTEKELDLFLRHLERSGQREKVRASVQKLARENNRTFDFQAYDLAAKTAKVQMLQTFFKDLSARSTARVLIELARAERLALIRYGKEWFFQVSQLFDLPLQFDIFIPEDGSRGTLQVRNLRDMIHDYSFGVYSAPNLPAQPKRPLVLANNENQVLDSSLEGASTAKLFQSIYKYFADNFNWFGYEGNNPNGFLPIYVDVATIPQNAHWDPTNRHVAIGIGGSQFIDMRASPSVLGHEFSHAIISNTSNLRYRSESGALNEHFADLQGASIASHYTGKPFNFLVGEDIVNPQVSALRDRVVSLALAAKGVDMNTAKAFSLDRTAMRNMIAPGFSLNAQVENYPSALQKYGPTCQPSAANDLCGVHDQSGVVNRAASLIIRELGAEKTRTLFFNTLTQRLGSNATFQEYGNQLFEECRTLPGLFQERDCGVIISAFREIGITVTPTPESRPAPTPAPTPVPAPEPSSAGAKKYCGWISVSTSFNVTVIDNKFDAVLMVKGNAITSGNFNAIYDYKCGCATGVLGKTTNSKGTVFNYFTKVVSTEMLAASACRNIIYK